MKRGYLSDYFVGVGTKQLSATDTSLRTSNGHEVVITREIRSGFMKETERKEFQVIYTWMEDDENFSSVKGTGKYYDSREEDPTRGPEWRLYYPYDALTGSVTDKMGAGDTLFLARGKNDILYFVVTPPGSYGEQQLSRLFGLEPTGGVRIFSTLTEDSFERSYAVDLILDRIGIPFKESETSKIESIVEEYGLDFPKTDAFSLRARKTLFDDVSVEDDPDTALAAWLAHEEAMFRTLEKRIISERLNEGFSGEEGPDVDGFMKFSLGVHNRRKSRMGRALENHLTAVFDAHDIRYKRNAVTERRKKPDFLFPDAETYRSAPEGGDQKIAMLGAKSSCKERWRQILTEADKIPKKHFLTLDTGISEAQLEQMHDSHLQLVIPESFQTDYADARRGRFQNLAEFIAEIAAKQA